MKVREPGIPLAICSSVALAGNDTMRSPPGTVACALRIAGMPVATVTASTRFSTTMLMPATTPPETTAVTSFMVSPAVPKIVRLS